MIFDKAFINGNIYTMEDDGTKTSAMLVHDGKIFEIGSDAEIKQYKVRETIDLEGKTVIPGLIDTHCHIPEMVEDSRKANLEPARSMEEVIEILKKNLETLKPDKWLIGRGISSSLLKENRLPNRYDLDKVTNDVPIYIMAFDGHSGMGNSKLLEIAEIHKGYKPKEGEILEFDEDGEPTGIFKEAAITSKLLANCPPMFDNDEECKEAIRECLIDYSKKGYTTQHTIMGLWPSSLSRARLFEEMNREKSLPMRVNMCFCDEFDNGMNLTSGIGDDRLRLGACKFFADGAMSERTAYMSQEYKDKAGWKGCMVLPEEEFSARIKSAYDLGNDVCIHIIGDAALDAVLDIIERIIDCTRDNRFELIHCAVTRPDQIKRMSKMPVIVHKQPIFIKAPTTLYGDKKIGELNKYYHGIKSFMDAGIIVTGGTDGPLSDSNPFMGIEAAVTRKAFDDKTVVNPQECIEIFDAVKMFTANASYAGREEHKKGMLKAGMLADFISLDRDIFNIDSDDIHNVRVLKTYIAGEPIY